jgi:hypothetical protein
MPRLNTASGFAFVMDFPFNRIEPLSTLSYPVMTLNSVVLPEPLGPINPVTEPCSTAIEQVERA